MYIKGQNQGQNRADGIILPPNYRGTMIGSTSVGRQSAGDSKESRDRRPVYNKSASESPRSAEAPIKMSPKVMMMNEGGSGVRDMVKNDEMPAAENPVAPERNNDAPKYWRNDSENRLPPSPPRDFGIIKERREAEKRNAEDEGIGGVGESGEENGTVEIPDPDPDSAGVLPMLKMPDIAERFLSNIKYEDLLIIGLILLLKQSKADGETLLLLAALLLF